MLESLHDRRVFVTSIFQRSINDAKSRLNNVGLKNEIDVIRRLVADKTDSLRRQNDVGTSVDSVDNLLQTTLEIQREASAVENRCVECVKASEGSELSTLAYSVLKSVAAYQSLIEQR